MFILQTIIEIAVAVFIIWGLFNEQTLVNFEDAMFIDIKAQLIKTMTVAALKCVHYFLTLSINI